MFYHTVGLSFKSSVDPSAYAGIFEEFKTLKVTVTNEAGAPYVKSFKYGKQTFQDRTKGVTHIVIVEFENEADFKAFLVHPNHVAFSTTRSDQVFEDMVVLSFADGQL
ncbi:hypothetical protein FISHEDRAFT_74361 [Fistulina hepatica ATCC 64428]|uniref:Stress-response A/B barrel domain-containing protein n=1 Tax=Fistulina hepatica ATCC 64428 TaxID=1128425 RepID=A0A0D7ACM6_9AGAR|nr:hypothetical protein FISHEDRAFT_74361 [Fistulina hepatica ATCC 64428]